MALEQYFTQGWTHMPAIASDLEHSKDSFECNICLDFAREPIVTLCGHLYCWPCIYKWLHVQSASLCYDEPPQCPVCKADICHTKMVPLYGRGQTSNGDEETELKVDGGSHQNLYIPPRPPACGSGNQGLTSITPSNTMTGQQLPYRNPYQNQHYNNNPGGYGDYHEDSSTPSMLSLRGGLINGFHQPSGGMFGEMIYSRVFGNSESLYSYLNSYHLMGSNTPRLRRLEMQADKSLHRISMFLFCCLVLCLIVF